MRMMPPFDFKRELLRTHVLGSWVNKGKKRKGRGYLKPRPCYLTVGRLTAQNHQSAIPLKGCAKNASPHPLALTKPRLKPRRLLPWGPEVAQVLQGTVSAGSSGQRAVH